jgi:hypothetical protein
VLMGHIYINKHLEFLLGLDIKITIVLKLLKPWSLWNSR